MSYARLIRRTRFGFTLIELIVAVVILAILAALAVPALRAIVGRSAEEAAFAELEAVSRAVAAYAAFDGDGTWTSDDFIAVLGTPDDRQGGRSYVGCSVDADATTVSVCVVDDNDQIVADGQPGTAAWLATPIAGTSSSATLQAADTLTVTGSSFEVVLAAASDRSAAVKAGAGDGKSQGKGSYDSQPNAEQARERMRPESPPGQDAKAEEPVAEQPPAEEPAAEEPVTEQPPAEEPPAEEPPAEEPVAEQPPAEEPVAAVAAGRAMAWGRDFSGELGDGGTNLDSAVPVDVVAPDGVEFVTLSAGKYHTVALDTAGNAWAWGHGTYGQLGVGDTAHRTTAAPVVMPTGVTFKEVVAGSWHTVAVDTTGNAWAWGYDYRGQLGDGGTNTNQTVPVAVAAPAGVAFTTVAGGDNHTVAIDTAGNAWAWGQDYYGQLGNYGTAADQSAPVAVTMPTGVAFTDVAADYMHTVAIDTAGNAWAWGLNGHGQLGDGSKTNRTVPTAVALPAGYALANVAAGDYHTVAIDTAGNAWAWGQDSSNQLGDGGSAINRYAPVPVVMPAGVRFVDVGAGYAHSVAVAADGTAWGWGNAGYGQLGIGTLSPNPSTPTKVTADGIVFTAITGGELHTAALHTPSAG